jgi:hypothetical protein
MNLLTCPDFSPDQPFGPIEKPSLLLWAPKNECPHCDYDDYDMEQFRVLVVKRHGWKIGLGAGKDDVGVDVYTHSRARSRKGFDEVPSWCCVVM